jgi:hypothetical protein
MPSATSHLERFLSAVHAIHSRGAGVPETSYYPDVKRLLEDVGGTLSPKVQPVIHIRDQGSGIPDGGLFIARQSGPVYADDPMEASAPERGALEVKPPDRDLQATVSSRQVRNYLERYGKVLVTTLREWTLVVASPTGRAKQLETFTIATTPHEFWAVAASAGTWAPGREEDFTGFLKRAMEHDAPLASPQDLAWLLAAHARLALERIASTDIPALTQLRTSLSDALDVGFEGERGEHFFRSTLVQTLFYGVFSAWVLWHRSDPPPDERFTWREAAWHLKVPMVGKLFEQVSGPSIMRRLKVAEIMDWTDEALGRVDRSKFFKRFEESKAVQYFYEPFLEHFDTKLREEYGVWYTPTEVVHYMVERVDRMLVTKFGFDKGLADDRVVILDPCVGTGSYLIAVLNKIAERLPDDALAAQDIKTAVMSRIFGFEVLPAPFVVAHLQLGLLLARLGAPLGDEERAAIYLTNSLTGWRDDQAPPPLPFEEFEDEREAAHSVKRDARIVVVLGNPPYYPFGDVNPAEEPDLVEPYKKGITTRNSLHDLYVRFYRIAERRIVEGTGYGIVCYISNFSYLHEPGFVAMRRSLLTSFDEVYIDCLNGDSRETGKRTPEGKPDPSIFSSSFNRAGIQVGTAIGTYVRRLPHGQDATVRFRDFWGADKKQQLISSANDDDSYADVELTEVNRVSFRPGRFSLDYQSWPQVVDFAASRPSLGLNENRGSVLIDPDKQALEDRMRVYLDSKETWEQVAASAAEPLTREWAGFDPQETRRQLVPSGFDAAKIVPFASRPLDIQWAYVEAKGGLWNRHRPDLMGGARPGNWFVMVRRWAPRATDGAATLPASCLGDQHVLHKDAYYLPVWQYPLADPDDGDGQGGLFDIDASPNLSPKAAAYLEELGVAEADPDYAQLLWWHVLAISYAPQYLADNPGGIGADWPRVPIPPTAAALRASAKLGSKLAQLLDPLIDVDQLSSAVGPIRRNDGTSIQPARGDLEVRAQWGIIQRTAVMPGHGKFEERDYTSEERSALGEAAVDCLGSPLDIYLNQESFWACVPERVWHFTIGGFPVLKKWLSYREHGSGAPLLGRSLTGAEARSFTNLAQRLAAVVVLQSELDANYLEVSGSSAVWP